MSIQAFGKLMPQPQAGRLFHLSYNCLVGPLSDVRIAQNLYSRHDWDIAQITERLWERVVVDFSFDTIRAA
jgi:hypothetical protein